MGTPRLRAEDGRWVVYVDASDPVRGGRLIGLDLMELFEQVIELRGESLPDGRVRWVLHPSRPVAAEAPL